MKTIESKIKRVPLINNVQWTIVVQMKRFISNVDEFIVKITITSWKLLKDDNLKYKSVSWLQYCTFINKINIKIIKSKWIQILKCKSMINFLLFK